MKRTQDMCILSACVLNWWWWSEILMSSWQGVYRPPRDSVRFPVYPLAPGVGMSHLLILSRFCWAAAGKSFLCQKIPIQFFYSWQVHLLFHGFSPKPIPNLDPDKSVSWAFCYWRQGSYYCPVVPGTARPLPLPQVFKQILKGHQIQMY